MLGKMLGCWENHGEHVKNGNHRWKPRDFETRRIRVYTVLRMDIFDGFGNYCWRFHEMKTLFGGSQGFKRYCNQDVRFLKLKMTVFQHRQTYIQ